MAKKIKKASALKRVAAFILDMLFITLVATLLSGPFIDSKKVTKINDEQIKISEQFETNEITVDQYMDAYFSIYYSLIRSTGVVSLITIVLEIIYFVVYQLYNGGQTIGKKVLGIKVISNDGELDMNQMIFRALLANFVLVNILKFALLLFSSRNIFINSAFILEGIQYLLLFVSLIMITGKNKDSIHDKITHTSVVCAK